MFKIIDLMLCLSALFLATIMWLLFQQGKYTFKHINAMKEHINLLSSSLTCAHVKEKENKQIIKKLQTELSSYQKAEAAKLMTQLDSDQTLGSDQKLVSDISYTSIKDFLRMNNYPVMYVEKEKGVTVREFEHPNPPFKAMARKLMLFAQKLQKEKNALEQEFENYKWGS